MQQSHNPKLSLGVNTTIEPKSETTTSDNAHGQILGWATIAYSEKNGLLKGRGYHISFLFHFVKNA